MRKQRKGRRFQRNLKPLEISQTKGTNINTIPEITWEPNLPPLDKQETTDLIIPTDQSSLPKADDITKKEPKKKKKKKKDQQNDRKVFCRLLDSFFIIHSLISRLRTVISYN